MGQISPFFLTNECSNICFYHRYLKNDDPNVFGKIKRSQMNIQKNLPLKKSTNILTNEYICPKYLNIYEYKNLCPWLFWTNLTILMFVCLFVCSLLRYHLNVFLPPLPEVKCPKFLEIRNPWEKWWKQVFRDSESLAKNGKKRSVIWKLLLIKDVKSPRKKSCFLANFARIRRSYNKDQAVIQ